jgi:hypothetical protein
MLSKYLKNSNVFALLQYHCAEKYFMMKIADYLIDQSYSF